MTDAVAGDTAFVWKERFERAYGRMFALETAFCRRLLRHNAGPGPVCECEDCGWLRSLFDENLPARLRREAERVTVATDFETAARLQMDALVKERGDAEEAIAAAVARRDAVKQERAALEAAIATYDRVRAKHVGPRPAVPARASTASGGKAFLIAYATERGGQFAIREAIEASVARGVYPTEDAAQQAISFHARSIFERVERGVYRVRDGEAA